MEPLIFTEEIFGHATDFEVKQERVGDVIKITVTTVSPRLIKDGDHIVSLKPPRYPWHNVK